MTNSAPDRMPHGAGTGLRRPFLRRGQRVDATFGQALALLGRQPPPPCVIPHPIRRTTTSKAFTGPRCPVPGESRSDENQSFCGHSCRCGRLHNGCAGGEPGGGAPQRRRECRSSGGRRESVRPLHRKRCQHPLRSRRRILLLGPGVERPKGLDHVLLLRQPRRQRAEVVLPQKQGDRRDRLRQQCVHQGDQRRCRPVPLRFSGTADRPDSRTSRRPKPRSYSGWSVVAPQARHRQPS